jgi:hypothetical protein
VKVNVKLEAAQFEGKVLLEVHATAAGSRLLNAEPVFAASFFGKMSARRPKFPSKPN